MKAVQTEESLLSTDSEIIKPIIKVRLECLDVFRGLTMAGSSIYKDSRNDHGQQSG